MSPLKLLFVHSSDEMYGADFTLKQLVVHLDRQRYEPLVILPNDVPQPGYLSQALRDQGLRVEHMKLAILRRQYFTPWGFLLYLWRLIVSSFSLARLIRREKIDLVHSHTTAVLSGAVAAYLSHTPHIWLSSEIVVRPRFLYRFLAWLLPRFSATVVAVSDATRAHLCAGDVRNEQKAITIHFGLEPAFVDRLGHHSTVEQAAALRKEWGLRPDQPLIGMVGRISHWKGQTYFLEVANLVSRQVPEARFALVGGTFHGNQDLVAALQSEIEERHQTQAVILEGFRHDIPVVLAAYDVFVLPSTLPDPFPTVVLEAMAAGKPIVANAHGGSLEMIRDGVTGYLTPPGRPQAMADAILRLLHDPGERAALGHNSRERLLATFTLENYLDQWQQLYETTLINSRGTRT